MRTLKQLRLAQSPVLGPLVSILAFSLFETVQGVGCCPAYCNQRYVSYRALLDGVARSSGPLVLVTHVQSDEPISTR